MMTLPRNIAQRAARDARMFTAVCASTSPRGIEGSLFSTPEAHLSRSQHPARSRDWADCSASVDIVQLDAKMSQCAGTPCTFRFGPEA